MKHRNLSKLILTILIIAFALPFISLPTKHTNKENQKGLQISNQPLSNLYNSLSFASVTSNRLEQVTNIQRIQDLFDAIDNNKEKHIVFLKELIKAQDEGEEAVQTLVAKLFEELGCAVEVLRVLPSSIKMEHEFAAEEVINNIERITVVGTFPGTGEGRSLLLYAHPDPEPITSTEDWIHDPFAAEIEGDRIYGWGVADDLAGVAVMYEALSALINTGLHPAGDVYLGSATTKQNARGIIALLSRDYHADGCIYLHPAESGVGLRDIKAITSGMLNFRVTVTGQQPATTEPGKTVFAHLGINAIDKAVLIKQALDRLNEQRGERVYYKPIDDKVGRSTNLLISNISSEGKGIPTKCTISASLTFPPFENLRQVQKEVENCIAEAAELDPWLREHPPSIVWLYGAEGMELPVEHPIYQTVSNAIQTVTGEEPFVNPLHAASSIFNPYLFSGIPTVGYGPLGGDLTQNGGHDEWIDLPDYIRAIKVTAKAIVEWCK